MLAAVTATIPSSFVHYKILIQDPTQVVAGLAEKAHVSFLEAQMFYLLTTVLGSNLLRYSTSSNGHVELLETLPLLRPLPLPWEFECNPSYFEQQVDLDMSGVQSNAQPDRLLPSAP